MNPLKASLQGDFYKNFELQGLNLEVATLKFFLIERILVSVVLKAIIVVVVKCLKTGRFTGGEFKLAVKILSNILIRIHSSFILFLDQTPRRRKPRSIASFGGIWPGKSGKKKIGDFI
jgi:hypothetical protein